MTDFAANSGAAASVVSLSVSVLPALKSIVVRARGIGCAAPLDAGTGGAGGTEGDKRSAVGDGTATGRATASGT